MNAEQLEMEGLPEKKGSWEDIVNLIEEVVRASKIFLSIGKVLQALPDDYIGSVLGEVDLRESCSYLVTIDKSKNVIVMSKEGTEFFELTPRDIAKMASMRIAYETSK